VSSPAGDTAVPDRPLLQLARAELHRAKQLRTARWAAHAVTFLVGLVGLRLSGNASYLGAMLTVVSEAVAWTLRQRSRTHHQRAEQGKRIAELRSFYDPTAAAGTETDFRRGVSAWACKHAGDARFDDAEYWDVSSGQGRDRLRKAVREAAWWSWSLYDEGSKVATWVAGVAVGSALAILFVFLFTGLASAAEEVARITLVVIAGLISADALTLRADWSSAAAESRSAYQGLSSTARTDADVFRLWCDYRTITAGTEPIPQWIYDKHRARLNTAWRAENTR
jgi:hypothetical protein